MDKNWIELLSLFDRYGVRYLIVGGWAVIFHTQPRSTKDLDLYIDPERTNAQAVYQALLAFGAPMSGMSAEDFEDAESIYQIGQPPLRVDLISGLTGIDFKQAWDSRIAATEDGVPVHYIGRRELIKNKLAAGRLQDLADAESLNAAEAATNESNTGDEE